LASADVNAGTASAAKIAIIAITTSNSISVNAEEGLLILIFMWVFFCFLLGFRLRTRLRRTGVLRVAQRVLGFAFWGLWFRSEVCGYRSLADKVNNFLEEDSRPRMNRPSPRLRRGRHGFAKTMFNVESTETAFHLLLRELWSKVLKNFEKVDMQG
jgi:hypothetical protein